MLAVDPGGTTGFAYGETDGHELIDWRAWHTPWGDAPAVIEEYVHKRVGASVDVLVMESFHISVNTAKKGTKEALETIELIGVGRYIARRHSVRFKTQTPSEAKMFATNDKLRALGMWTRGLDHPRDATRHLLLFVCTERAIDLRKLVG